MNRRYTEAWGQNSEWNRSSSQVKTSEWRSITKKFCLQLWKLVRTLTRCIMGRASSPPWDDCWIMVRGFPKSAHQPNEMALIICNPISRYCFRLMRDWKLENLPNGKEISVVPFRIRKEEYLWRYSTISERNFRKITVPFDFKRKFPEFLAKW